MGRQSGILRTTVTLRLVLCDSALLPLELLLHRKIMMLFTSSTISCLCGWNPTILSVFTFNRFWKWMVWPCPCQRCLQSNGLSDALNFITHEPLGTDAPESCNFLDWHQQIFPEPVRPSQHLTHVVPFFSPIGKLCKQQVFKYVMISNHWIYHLDVSGSLAN